MPVTDDQIRSVAELGAKIIELQLQLADVTAKEAFYQIWPFAYCYGAFEALARHNGMETDAPLLIALGFHELEPDRDGRKRLEQASGLQENSFFIEGRAHGFDDLSRFATEEGYRPLMLMNFFAFGKPAAL